MEPKAGAWGALKATSNVTGPDAESNRAPVGRICPATGGDHSSGQGEARANPASPRVKDQELGDDRPRCPPMTHGNHDEAHVLGTGTGLPAALERKAALD